MNPENDQSCGWINALPPRINIKTLKGEHRSDWIVVGAGLTGLSAARQLGILNPNQKIILIDAQLAGEGASSRNSGYLVNSTLNDGFVSNKELTGYKEKTDLYGLGIKSVKDFIKTYQVKCDWNECGKYYASSQVKDINRLVKFGKILSSLNVEHQVLYREDLKKRLGTNFYYASIYTKNDILINPAKLSRSMVDSLPENVKLFENSKLIKWNKRGKLIDCKFEDGKVLSSKIIFCTNGFLRDLGIKTNYSFPLLLSASMSRQLTDEEFISIGKPQEWGVLSVKPMGATVRMTKDRRILIRNTAEVSNQSIMKSKNLNKRIQLHSKGIKKRFPTLPDNIIESSWTGVACRSGNAAQIFDKIDDNIFAVGCFNGSGIGLGTLFGEQIAYKACNQITNEMISIEKNKKPNWLPPEPFLSWGVRARLFRDRILAKSDS
tara:strand:+ start:1051 stop:2355 length:1305 start_codon:yes stop_codon:yes gene_type:complete